MEIFPKFKPKRFNKNGMVSEWNDDKLRGMWYHDSLELLYIADWRPAMKSQE